MGRGFSLLTLGTQKGVARYGVGTATGAMNFFRALISALVVAIMGAIILAGIGGEPGRAVEILSHVAAKPGSVPIDLSEVFRWVFVCSVIFLLMSIVALTLMEERPLRGRSEAGPKG